MESELRMQMTDRLQKLRTIMEEESVDGFLVSSVPNVTYLSGFSGDSALALVGRERQLLITDVRYIEQAESECPGWEVVRHKKGIWKTTARLASDVGIRRLGFETGHITHLSHSKLSSDMGGITLVAIDGKVEHLRQFKDDKEVKLIEAALRCQEDALREVVKWMKPGMTEKQIACELDYRMRRAGADEPAFETIAAVGKRASLPHARATERVVRQGDTLLIDWGARCFFYNSDLTRVFVFGTIPSEYEKIYGIVKQAQEHALAVIRPGVTFSEVDSAARGFIRDHGYGEEFGHSLGHGVGLEVHERPTVREGNEDRLQPGMVFTVEPGIYIPGWGGVRIEDMVLVVQDGVRVLSGFEKELDRMIL